MKRYDLRSDTVTKPTDAMREAMASAPVGDDVYGEDPAVNRLEKMGAEITGKEQALFVSSGSMGNLIALYINGGRGNEVLTHKQSHIIEHELGSPAAIAGVLCIGLEGEKGQLTPEVLKPHLFERDYATAPVGLIEVENTTNGFCYSLGRLSSIKSLAARYGVPVHMDGARLMNAAVAGGHAPEEICRHADTVTFCLSKGLGAPVGSLLCGSRKFIARARTIRKMLGGGLRQAGIIAAGGIYALEHHIKRLADDHRNAQKISQTLAETDWAEINPAEVETNIIIFSTKSTPAELIVKRLGEKGIDCFPAGEHAIRMVTSLGISGEDTKEICTGISTLQI